MLFCNCKNISAEIVHPDSVRKSCYWLIKMKSYLLKAHMSSLKCMIAYSSLTKKSSLFLIYKFWYHMNQYLINVLYIYCIWMCEFYSKMKLNNIFSCTNMCFSWFLSLSKQKCLSGINFCPFFKFQSRHFILKLMHLCSFKHVSSLFLNIMYNLLIYITKKWKINMHNVVLMKVYMMTMILDQITINKSILMNLVNFLGPVKIYKKQNPNK